MSETKKMLTLFYGGVVNIGRTINFLPQNVNPLAGISEMASADLRLVDLESVIATKGEQRNSSNTFYFRARPEQTNILVNNNIDIVLTANDHTGDYGAEALLEQREYLDAAGILHTGSGKNLEEAFTPVYKKVGDVTLAIFSVDSTKQTSAATADSPGTAYLPADKPELWQKFFSEKISATREKADVIIIAPHWGLNIDKKPSENMKALGHLLIDLGADAVLGCNSHLVHGVENYKERPIIYDAGDLLFDWGKRSGGGFVLEISSSGVEKVKFIPLDILYCQTLRAQNNAPAILNNFIAACKELKTVSTIAGDIAEITLNPPPRQAKHISDALEIVTEKRLIAPLAAPRPEWTVDKIPDEAIITPKSFGELKLVGYYVPPECRVKTEPRMLYVETYWMIDEPTDKNYFLSIKSVPVLECAMTPYSINMTHEFLDYMYPTNRWQAGVIYRERVGLPSPPVLTNVDLQVGIKVFYGRESLGEFKAPNLIKMQIANLPLHKTDFDDVIYQSEPGKCWTSEQIAKVTGGEWIVPPRRDWYVNSLSKSDAKGKNLMPRPTLFVATTANFKNYYEQLIANLDSIDGAIVDRTIKGLPYNFPQLKVDNLLNATLNLGVAARKRFQGKVIAVTGSEGKTATCNMLSFILGREHKVAQTPPNQNTGALLLWSFAHVKQNDAYAIIEMSAEAFNRPFEAVSAEIKPHVAIVTSLSTDKENIAKIESRIFNGMSANGYAVLNRDMPHYELFEQRAKSLNLNIITFGTHPDATIRESGGKFFIDVKTYELPKIVPAEQLYDALAVVATSLVIGIPIEKTLEDLNAFNSKTLEPEKPIVKPDTSDIKTLLPVGIAPEQNGVIPVKKLKKIGDGGHLYIDTARAWLAMVRAAAQDKISLSLNNRFDAYRNIGTQIKVFKERFEPVASQDALPADAIKAEYDGKVWKLKPNASYVEVPGQSAHGYGLAVDIQNADLESVKTWLDKNAARFGFFKEYDSKRHYFLYVKAREKIPARVLEIEKIISE